MPAAPVVALVDFDRVARYIGQTGTRDDDTLELLLAASSRAVEEYCGRRFARQAYLEVRDGRGAAFLPTRQWPLVSVEAVLIDGRPVPARAAIGQPGFFGGEQSVYLSGGLTFARGRANVELHYTAGYDAVPEDVQLAVCELVAYARHRKSHPGLTSEALNGATTSYFTGPMPDPVRQLLASYRQVCPL